MKVLKFNGVPDELTFGEKPKGKVKQIMVFPEEKAIWDQFRKGDREALAWIYHHYHQALYQYGKNFLADTMLVGDCIHDLFLQLQGSHEKLSATDSIRFYLFRSFRRLLVKATKKNKKVLGDDQKLQEEAFQVVMSHESELIACETETLQLQQLAEALNQLPIRQREAIYYYFYQNFSYDEIAEIMDFAKVKYARTLVYRALDSLRVALQTGGHGQHSQLGQMLTMLWIAQGAGLLSTIPTLDILVVG